jgi:hypothetical protein
MSYSTSYFEEFRKHFCPKMPPRELASRLPRDGALLADLEFYLRSLVQSTISKDIFVYLSSNEFFAFFEASVIMCLPTLKTDYEIKLSYLMLDTETEIEPEEFDRKIDYWLRKLAIEYEEIKIFRDPEKLLEALLDWYASQYPDSSKVVKEMKHEMIINRLSQFGRKENG